MIPILIRTERLEDMCNLPMLRESAAEADVVPVQRVMLQELSMREREEMLRGWSALHAELRALHDVWQCAHAAALHQREQVSAAPAPGAARRGHGS